MLFDEITLIDKLHHGDENALGLLYKEYYTKLFNFALYFHKDTCMADEAVQDVFISLWENRSRIRITTSFRSYLFRSVHNRCLNLIKQQNTLQHNLEEYFCYLEEEAHLSHMDDRWFEDTFSDVKLIKLRICIDSFPAQQKHIFNKIRIEGKSYKEVSEELGISVNTIKTQLLRAITKLKKEFCADDE